MLKLLQIDTCLGILSTGRITECIGKLAKGRGWDCYVAHGARYVGQSQMQSFYVDSKLGEYIHYIQSLLFDRHGLGSYHATKRLVHKIQEINPDIIHLHCIHGYYLNYKVLFEYLNSSNIPVVWTFHDCWAFTGHCSYFDSINCRKWETGCFKCDLIRDYPKSLFVDRSKFNYDLKKSLFSNKKNSIIVPVSHWLENIVRKSFFSNHNIKVIHNGIDIQLFRPLHSNMRECYDIPKEKKVVLGVASPWSKRKGLYDIIKLSSYSEFQLVVVGVSAEQKAELKANGIIAFERTNNIEELVEIYNMADVFINPTYSDNFPTTNMEALACGTPVITYNTGGSPESIDDQTGIVVDQGNIDALVSAISKIPKTDIVSNACRNRAEQLFDKNKRFMDYINLYEELITNK